MRKKSFVSFALALTLTFATALTAQAAALGDTQITFEGALESAVNAVGGGLVTEVDWDNEHGSPTYELEVYYNGRKHEIKINAVTGEFIKHKSKETTKTVTGITASQVTSAKATELIEAAAAQAGGGTASEVEFDLKNGVLVCDIEIYNAGVEYEAKYNVSTGELIQHKTEGGGNGNSGSGTIDHLQ